MSRKRGRYFGGNPDLSDGEASQIFLFRWKLGLWLFLIPFLCSFATFAISLEGGNWPIFLGAGLLFIAIIYISIIYRCPRCGVVPKSSAAWTSGVLLFPRRCSNCKATLLPSQYWSQD